MQSNSRRGIFRNVIPVKAGIQRVVSSPPPRGERTKVRGTFFNSPVIARNPPEADDVAISGNFLSNGTAREPAKYRLSFWYFTSLSINSNWNPEVIASRHW